jgi:hypothetical protein
MAITATAGRTMENDRNLEAHKITALTSAFGGKADIANLRRRHVRLWPKADLETLPITLCTKSADITRAAFAAQTTAAVVWVALCIGGGGWCPPISILTLAHEP